MSYSAVSPWQTGDIVSATKLGQMADNISFVAGLRDQRYYPYDSGADVVRGWNGDTPILRRPTEPWELGKTHDAWVLHNGDTLVVYAEIDAAVVNEFGVTYDYGGADPQHFSLANGLNTFALETGGYYRWQPIRVFVSATNLANPPGQPGGSTGGVDDSLWVRYIYTTNSNAPEWGTLPAFTNGTPSSAADFNAINDAALEALDTYQQPIAGCYYWSDKPTTVERGFYAYQRRYSSRFWFDLVIGPANDGDYAFLNINGENVWGYTFGQPGSLAGNTFDGRVSIVFADMGNPPSVGDWYSIQFGYNGGAAAFENTCVYLWSCGEEEAVFFGGFAALPQWAEGDTVDGAELVKMRTNLVSLNNSRRWLNMACRVAHLRINSPDELWGRYTMYRVHRWLAYENWVKDDGTRGNAQIEWQSVGRALQRYSLPTLDSPGFIDLESTPIKPGQYMRITGVKFAIQSPDAVGGRYV